MERTSRRTAALCGALTWLTYGILETLAFALQPAWTLTPIQYIPLHTGWLLTLLVVYPALGAGLTAALHSLLSDRYRIPRWLAAETLTLLWFLSVVLTGASEEGSKGDIVALEVFAGALLLSIGYAHRREAWTRRLNFLVSPWGISAVLVTTCFWSRQEDTGLWVAAFSLGTLVILTTDFYRLRNGTRQVSAAGVGVCVVLGVATVGLNAQANRIESVVRDTPQSAVGVVASLPNIVLVVMDTVRADHLSLYGYARNTTPYLEKLAAESRVYRRATAPAGMTLASHASMFTGLYPSRHRAHPSVKFGSGRPLPLRYETLAERLSTAGYTTAGVAANTPYLTKHFGLTQGFCYYDVREPIPFVTPGAPQIIRALIAQLAQQLLPPVAFDIEFRPGAEITASALDWLRDMRPPERPFFLFVNYMDAHWPTLPPPPFRDRYGGRLTGFTSADFDRLEYEVLTLTRSIRDDERAHLTSQYDGAIAYIDHQIETLVEALDEDGLGDNTLLLILSDHGEALGEKDHLTHGTSLYQNIVGVPFLARWPGHLSPGWSEERVSLVDVFPTVLSAANLSVPEGIDGAPLADRSRREAVFSESYPDATYRDWTTRFRRNLRAVFDDDMKWIQSSRGSHELYDLGNDPLEEAPLQTQVPEDMRSHLESWLQHASEDSPPSTEEVHEELKDILKSIGYVR